MKSIFNFFMLAFLLSMTGIQSLSAQDDKKDGYGGHWFLGLNGGAAWQQSDVKALWGGGGGFYLGKNIFYRPTSPLSLDLRFRYLGTATFGQDYQITDITNNSLLNGGSGSAFAPNYYIPGVDSFVFHNHRTGFHDLSLEARLNFENLRRKYNIWLSIYGGAGVGFYRVKYDQLDLGGNEYIGLYNSVRNDASLSNDQIVSQLQAGRDGDFETWMDGSLGGDYKATFTPDLGIELGYWVTPRFAIGVGHRVNWTLRDDFDGVIRLDPRKGKDIHHYANLFLHFRLNETNTRQNPVRPIDPIPNPIVSAPQVEITTPGTDPATVDVTPTRIRANIRNVETASGVVMYVNNSVVSNYTFTPSTDILEAYVNLNVGANTVRITGTNASGTASDQVTIFYQPQQVAQNPPTVTITNPAGNPHNTSVPTQTINATITAVTSANNITFTVNGQNIRNFTFSGNNFTATGVALVQGNNSVVITANNPDGTASDQVNIVYQTVAANPPTVNITTPGTNPYNTQNPSETIRATITNVTSVNNVTFTVNGQNIRNFSFSGTSFVATNIALAQGSNTIVITGTNNDGNASDQTVITYQPVRQPMQPTVNITVPAANPSTTAAATANIRATITNVPTRTGVTFTFNGQNLSNFSFSGTSFVADNIALQQGNNTVIITGTNQDGTASDQTVIIYQPVRQPTVDITNPSNNPHNTNVATQTINATITNVPTANNVTFTVNGQNIRNFTFSGTSFTAVNVPLQQGSNAVVVTATTNDGTASDNATIIYQPTRVSTPPTVTITNPAANPFNTTAATQTISATITNVPGSNNVTMTVNGQPYTSFSYNGTILTAVNVSLQPGNNTVVITGTNQDGTASDQTNIVYNAPCPQPTVNITSPANGSIATGMSANIAATLTNVTDKNDIDLRINGQNTVVFNYNNRNGLLTTSFNLQNGANSISISVRTACGTASQTVTVNTRQVQNPPTVNITNPSANPYSTSIATQNISATITNVTGNNNVRFTVNGQNVSNFTFSGTSFTANNIALQQGSNTIIITGTNPDGTASDQTVINYQPVRVPTPPTVTITNPSANPFNTSVATQNISATITNVTGNNNVRFSVNGQNVSNFTFSGTSFTANNIALQQGSNTIIITGTNQDGTASDQTVINYQPVRVPTPPTVTITNPSANPFNTSVATQNISATITNVTGNNNVRFTVNGQTLTNFSFSGTSFTANNIALQQGNNTVVITGTNPDGTASDQTVIIYKPMRVPTPPTVTITNPSANPFNTSVATQNISATITNVTGNNNVRFTVNGQNVSNFTFSGTSFTANNIALQQGSNTIIITGTNQDGTASDQTVINYQPVRVPTPPTVNITTPSAAQSISSNPTATINATITNIANAGGVRFTVNGQNNSNFTLTGTAFSAGNINLQDGANTFVITATNQDGNATDQATISFTKPVEIRIPTPPTVNITNPSSNPYNTNTATTAINATVTNVTNAQNVTVNVNGQNIRNYTLNGTTVAASGINLNPGNNTITVTATNQDGTANDNVTIIYTAPVQPPVVTITQPSTNPSSSPTNTATIRATILHVANSSNVAFSVNGQYVTNFSFSGTNFTANNVPLNQGANTITIVGNNSAGTDSKSTVINYNPVAAPQIVDMTAGVQPQAGQGCRVTVFAGVSNVTNISQIVFKINNVVTTGGTFSNGVFQYSYNVTSNNPSTINYSITATNDGGTVTESKTGNVGNCAIVSPPDVRNSNVQVAPQNGNCMATVTAQMVNVDNANQITFTVNGQRNTAFTYSNGAFRAVIDLTGISASSISFVISATTSAGNDAETVTGNLSACVSAPVITNMRAAQQLARAGFEATITATITGVQNSSQIVFKVNGQASTAFTFNNGAFTAAGIPMAPGNNTYSITATNSAGTATDTETLTDGSQNRPVDNGNKADPKDQGKGGKLNPVEKPAEVGGKGGKGTAVNPAETGSKGGKLDKKEGDK